MAQCVAYTERKGLGGCVTLLVRSGAPDALPDPTRRMPTCCELGYISTLAASTLREMGFLHQATLDGRMRAWRELGYPLKVGREP